MLQMSESMEHERVSIRRGERSGLTIVVAVHSTRLGRAVGGCRMWTYGSWVDGLADALRLSEAMSLKCAAAGIKRGGGKSVIVLSPGTVLAPDLRVAAMLDLGDVIEDLAGEYITGEDVGTSSEDMQVVRQCTPWVATGSPLPAPDEVEPTSLGVYSSLVATAEHIFGRADLRGRSMSIIGLGAVGAPLARLLAADGARLLVSDVDETKRATTADLGAEWITPADALHADVDFVVPAALGGLLSPESVAGLRCRAVVGPANNQLTDDGVADLLADRGIVWAPDFIVNAGGAVWGVGTKLDGRPPDEVLTDVEAIGSRLAVILAQAAETRSTPLATALVDARNRLNGSLDAGAGDPQLRRVYAT